MYSRKTKKPPLQPATAPKSVATAMPDSSPDSTAQLARQELVNHSATVQLGKKHDKKLYLNIEATVDGETKKYRDVPMAELKSHPGKTDYDAMALEYVKGLEGADSVVLIVEVKTYSSN